MYRVGSSKISDPYIEYPEQKIEDCRYFQMVQYSLVNYKRVFYC